MPESVITRITGSKYVFQRLKLHGSELNELAWFVFSGHVRAFGRILLSSLFIHLSPSVLVFKAYTHLQADITITGRSIVIPPHLLPGKINTSKGASSLRSVCAKSLEAMISNQTKDTDCNSQSYFHFGDPRMVLISIHEHISLDCRNVM